MIPKLKWLSVRKLWRVLIVDLFVNVYTHLAGGASFHSNAKRNGQNLPQSCQSSVTSQWLRSGFTASGRCNYCFLATLCDMLIAQRLCVFDDKVTGNIRCLQSQRCTQYVLLCPNRQEPFQAPAREATLNLWKEINQIWNVNHHELY